MNFKRISSCVVGMVFLMVAGQAQSNNRLAWTEWNQNTPGSIKPSIVFTDSSISAFAGCNRIFGQYNLKGSSLSFSKLGSTRMACEEAKMKLERNFIDTLTKIQGFKLSKDGKTLNLIGKNTRLNFGFARATPNAFVESSRKILNVSPQMTTCFDDAQKQCLLLEDLSDGTGWGKFTESGIEGLNFEAGYSYQIQVAVETNPRNQQRRLRLLELVMQHWTKPVVPSANQKILEVAPTLVDCVGVGQTQCLQVREPGRDWQILLGVIEKFNFKPNFSYKLLVYVINEQNPPNNASDSKYALVRLLDLDPVRR